MAGGRCTATVIKGSTSKIVILPMEYWNLVHGGTYRAVLTPAGALPGFIPYSWDAKIYSKGKKSRSGTIIIPSCINVSVGDKVHIWLGDMEDYYEKMMPNGRGRNQADRAKDLERAEDLLS